MNYEVVWGPRAERMLAAVWLAADQDGVTVAAAWLDAALARNPLRIGESRQASVYRVAHCRPIGVEYEVIEDDKRVIVQGVFAAP